MKRFLAFPLAWSCALLIALVLLLALAALFTGRELEDEAVDIQSDSVPGLINAYRIRRAYAEGFGCALLMLEASGPERAALKVEMATLDATAHTACENYRRSIHIDPVADGANFNAVLRACDGFLQRRTRFIELIESGATDEARHELWQELRPSYDALMTACSVLAAYNDRTGTTISASMLTTLVQMRWVVIAVFVLALIAGGWTAISLRQQRRVEAALRVSEAKFGTIFRVSPHAMMISRRADGTVFAANDAFKREYGVTDAEIVGKNSLALGFWSGAAERTALIEKIQREGRLRGHLKTHIPPDGRTRMALVDIEPVRLGDEDCLLSIGQDVTELYAAEQAATRSALELRAIFESAAIGMTLVQGDGHVIRCNPAFARFLGYSTEEICRMEFNDFTHPEDRAAPKDLDELQGLIAGVTSVYQREKRYRRKDGATVWGHLTISTMRDADGKFVYGIAMLEDITERRQAEGALRESEAARENLQRQLIVAQKLEAVGQLAGGVAHDFNNMLAAMMLYLDLLKFETAIPPAMRDVVGEITTAAKRAAGLTRQLLLFSRREPVQYQTVDLVAVVANLVKMLQRLVGEHLTLVQTGGKQPLPLRADAGMLEQVVMNLVVNARDAMPAGGRIVLGLDEIDVSADHVRRHPQASLGRFARLTVTDTGSGMSPATQARLFEPFFTTKEAGKGTGLGLSTVFGIVQQHAGWIEVESTEGKGTTFAVYLPLQGGAISKAAGESIAMPPKRGTETIVLAEDNEPVRLVAVRVLRQHGYKVLEAADGKSAKELLEANAGRVDLLITDVVMPGGLMGHDLARALPQNGSRPRVILMSGHNTQVDRTLLDLTGAVYLSKPFDSDRLLRVVRTTLDDGKPSA